MKRNSNSAASSKDKIIIVFVALVGGWFLFDTFFIGNIAYLSKWQECGTKPVTVTQAFSVGFGYEPPTYTAFTKQTVFSEKKPLVFDTLNVSMHCSLDEVKQRYGDDIEVRN